MQPKLDYYIQLATQTELDAASSPEKWRSYLALASRLYKYDHPDQILIYAQRPNATACAEYEVWNRAMNRYIKRGAKGIALLTDSGNSLKIRYVFDAADTGAGRDAKMPNPWKLEQRHHDFVQKQMSTMYQVSGNDLSQVISAVAQKKTDAYWDVNRDEIMKALQNDGIEMEEHQIEAQYKAALHESVRYSISLRCGLLSETQELDLGSISQFQTVHAVSQLGAAVSRINYSILRQISQCIQKAERAEQKERMKNHGKDQRSTEDLLRRRERTVLQAGGGLLHPGSETDGYGHDPNRQVWKSPQEIPEGAAARNLFSNAADRGTVSPSQRGGQGGTGAPGTDDAAAGKGSRRNGGTESQRSAEMGGADERLQSTGRGDYHGGTGLRLIQLDNDDQISLFPSEGKQIEHINEKAESEQPSAFSFVQEDIDHVLRLGGNTVHHRELIVDAFQKQKNLSEIAEYLKTIYKGGNGFIGNSGKISAWYAEDGIYLSYGSSARYNQSAKVVPWEQAAERIDVLLQRGQFATTVELAEAEGYVRTKTAEKLLYLYQDLSRKSKDTGYLSSIAKLRGKGFPEETNQLSDLLKSADFRRGLQDEFEKFQIAYQQDPDMLRFRYRDLHRIGNALAELDLPRLEFDGGMVVPHYAEQFITEDELDAAFSHGSGVAGGESRITQFFQESHSLTEKVEFLKREYGTGGRSHAVGGSDYSWEDHDSRGIRFTKMECQTISFTWENVAKRISNLIRQGRYLNHDKKNEIAAPQDAPAPVLESAVKTSHPDINTAQESEKFIDHFYVVEDLSVRGPLNLTEYGTLPEALNAYFALPSSQMKALGAQNTRSPLPGSLDFLQCISGRDKVIEDYLKVDGWDCCVGIIEQIEEAIADYVRREDPLEPGYSPWGEVDSCSYLQSGVFEVSTPSHGGVMIDCQCEEEILSPAARNVGFIWGGYHCYEEDADAPVAIRELLDKGIYTPPVNDYWKPGEYEKCIDCSIQNWHPDYWNDREARVTATNTYKGSAVEETKRHVEVGNFQITDENLGAGTPKSKFESNLSAVRLLKELEEEKRQAIPAEQEILSQYVGWGGLADAFDPNKENWNKEYQELKEILSPSEYEAARASTLNAHYTSPTIIRAMYDAVAQMGFDGGNILEPSCGVGNFFGMLPPEMQSSHLYGVELDSITGRIAKQLYPKAEITVAGFETTDRRDFFDLAIGNVPFGQYQVNDKAYNKLGFNIHNYFFAKALDQVRPGGVVAFVTSRYTMDQKSPEVRQYLAQRAELLGAIRLPNNAFKANAGTEVVSDIIFLQKRERPIVTEPDWVHLGQTAEGYAVNGYFVEHPEMVLGQLKMQSGRYGEELTVEPTEGKSLADRLSEAITHINGSYQPAQLQPAQQEQLEDRIPADPNVKNFSYTVISGQVYFREDNFMRRVDGVPDATLNRIKGMVELHEVLDDLIDAQLEDLSDEEIKEKQQLLENKYDAFVKQHGLINAKVNAKAFDGDSAYYLLCSLEKLDEDKNMKGKADIFYKRTIRPVKAVDRVDTPSEALAVSIGFRGKVDLDYMSELLGGKEISEITNELQGVIFKDPAEPKNWLTADEYLSGNVRIKLQIAQNAAQQDSSYGINVQALEKAQPKELEASEIDVRLGATWVDKHYIQQFMRETFDTPYYLRHSIKVEYSPSTADWQISGKTNISYNDVAAYTTYGTERASAYRILEDTLNLKDVRIYDYIEDSEGRKKPVLNQKETTLAQQKQQAIKDAFADWVWKDPARREELVKQYNELFNSTKPREYDGSHIVFGGMNPQIQLREHQRNAIAHVLYGGNTLLAHEVGAGKTFEMIAAAMESKRLGLCQKSMFVVPNHLTEQWAAEFLRLYPAANLLVTTKKDFEPANRKKFCARIATGDYDAVIIGHSQFEKIPVSPERQEDIIRGQISDIEEAVAQMKYQRSESFSIKQMEKTKKSLQVRLEKLNNTDRKDDVINFEQLGVDRLFVDESQAYKNLFLYTKMRNVAGLSTSESQRSSDMFMKCQYLDEKTGGRGVIFASGTPVSNSMTELYTVMRYLQYNTIQRMGLTHFDAWASTFGETATAIELAPEGTGYRARTRFAKFFNLPELMNLFKEVADIKTADQLHLPVPEAKFETVVVQPSEHQKSLVQQLSERAATVHNGTVDPSVDNMLKITSDGRKLGLDQRLMNPLLPDDPGSKLNACVNNVLRIWNETKAEKSAQMIFCDLSTPKDDGTFSVYSDIRQKLLNAGVPKNEIAFIHNANTEAKKAELFAKVRSGQVRVLLGSTQKMGAGTNCQDRLIALHHLDVPWRPSDMTQRNGRIIRQGNQNKEVQVYQYVTEGTFDAYLYQTLENKQKFISQIMTSKSPVRSCDDVDEQALSYAEIKALCAGNPLIKEKMDLDIEVSKLRLLKADHQNKRYRLEDKLLKFFPEEIQQTKSAIQGYQHDISEAQKQPQIKDGFVGMTIGKTVFHDKEQAGDAILNICKTLKNTDPVHLGQYRGFDMSLAFYPLNNEYRVTLRNEMSYPVPLGTDARGVITRLDNMLDNISAKLEWAQERLQELEKQVVSAEEEIEKPFQQEDILAQKSTRLAELNLLLDLGQNNGEQHPEEDKNQSAPERSDSELVSHHPAHDNPRLPSEKPQGKSLAELMESARNYADSHPQSITQAPPSFSRGR